RNASVLARSSSVTSRGSLERVNFGAFSSSQAFTSLRNSSSSGENVTSKSTVEPPFDIYVRGPPFPKRYSRRAVLSMRQRGALRHGCARRHSPVNLRARVSEDRAPYCAVIERIRTPE